MKRQDEASADVLMQAQPILDAFYSAVIACGRHPPFKPAIRITTSGPTRYDHVERSIVLVPYDSLDPGRHAAMERFAAIGTLGLSGRDQYVEIFNRLLVVHELGHWVQEVSRRPLSRWQAEYEANRMMVAFWRDHPTSVPTEQRLSNFVAQPAGAPEPVPAGAGVSAEEYFNTHVAAIEVNPLQYALFQKLMVRQVMAETPWPSFCETIRTAWPAG